jgi:hypothetical protein
MKQTAVEWYENEINALFDKYEDKEISKSEFLLRKHNLFYPAKQMHKEEIIEAVNTTIKGIRVDKQRKGFFVVNGEGYYASTYEANKND